MQTFSSQTARFHAPATHMAPDLLAPARSPRLGDRLAGLAFVAAIAFAAAIVFGFVG